MRGWLRGSTETEFPFAGRKVSVRRPRVRSRDGEVSIPFVREACTFGRGPAHHHYQLSSRHTVMGWPQLLLVEPTPEQTVAVPA